MQSLLGPFLDQSNFVMKLLARVKISKIVPLLAEIKCQIRIGILKLLRWGKKRPEIGIFKNLILIFGIFVLSWPYKGLWVI